MLPPRFFWAPPYWQGKRHKEEKQSLTWDEHSLAKPKTSVCCPHHSHCQPKSTALYQLLRRNIFIPAETMTTSRKSWQMNFFLTDAFSVKKIQGIEMSHSTSELFIQQMTIIIVWNVLFKTHLNIHLWDYSIHSKAWKKNTVVSFLYRVNTFQSSLNLPFVFCLF